MSSIDRRVVEVEFSNKQFEQGIQDTLASLEELKTSLKLEGATQGLQNINTAGQQTDLSGIATGVDHISSRFSALGAVGFTIIQNLTTSAMGFASRIAGLTLDPLVAGGRRRSQNIEQAKFQFRGLGVNIEKAMDDALYAVLGTAYGLDEAARAASQLSASQVELGDDMKAALRGISGVAAMTNSSYEDTARIFTRVAGQGRVMAVDLNSLAARGLNAAAVLAEQFGVTEGELREMVSAGEIGFPAFATAMNDAFGENATKANETYTGSLSNLRAALSRIGASFFTPQLEDQRDLFNAITPAIDAVGEALEPVISLMNETSRTSVGNIIDFLESLDFSKLSLAIDPILRIVTNISRIIGSLIAPVRNAFEQIFPPASIEQIGEILTAIADFVETIKIGADSAENLRRTFAGVFAVFSIGWTVIKETARFLWELFDTVSEGSGGFLEATGNVGDFLVALDQAIKNGDGLRTFFINLRGAMERPLQVLRTFGEYLSDIFDFEVPEVDGVTGSFEPLAVIGNVLLQIWDGLLDAIGAVWDRFFEFGTRVVRFVDRVAAWISEAMGGLEFGDVIDVLQTGVLATIAYNFEQFVDGMGNKIGTLTYRLTQPFNQLTITLNVMQNTLRSMTLMNIALAIGILTASVVALSLVDAAGLRKALAAISAMMTQLVVSMAAFQKIGGSPGIVRTGAGLVLFAAAIRVLTSSVKALAELSWDELAKGLAGTTILIAALVGATQGMSGHTAGMFRAAAGLLVLSVAIRILTGAVKNLADLGWEEMARGLVGVGALLTSLVLFTKFMDANKGGIAQGAGLVLLATGIKILASAAQDFAALTWEEVGRGLSAITAILAAFAIFTQTTRPERIVATGAALVLISGAMKIMASAIADFGAMSWDAIARGLTAMAGALLGIVIALNLMPPSTLASAAALVVVGAALGLIADALVVMGDQGWDEILKGISTLALALGLIVAATLAMTAALPGAAAIFVVASALRVLAPVITTFGEMSLGEIALGLGALAAVFVILGVAGALLTPTVPTLLGVGLAIAMIGAGAALAGFGIAAFAAGLTALAAAGAAGTAALVGLIAAFVGMIPMMARALGMAVIAFAEVIGQAGPAILEAFTAVFGALIGAIAANGPLLIDTLGDLALKMIEKMEETIPPMAEAALGMMIGILQAINENIDEVVDEVTKLLTSMLRAMARHAGEMVSAGVDLIVAFIDGIAGNLGRIISSGAELLIAFIVGIGRNSVRVIDAGFDAVIDFLNGVARSIRTNAPELRAAGRNIAMAIADGLTGGLASKIGEVARGARDLARSALDSARSFLSVASPSKAFMELGEWSGEGLAIGIQRTAPLVSRASRGAGEEAVDAMRRSISEMSNVLDLDTDLSPRITPIIDMSEIKRGASMIGQTIAGKQIAVDAAFMKAKDASDKYNTNLEVGSEAKDAVAPVQMTYIQNNNSPKALSQAEIYRQTKNQLATSKGALTTNVVDQT